MSPSASREPPTITEDDKDEEAGLLAEIEALKAEIKQRKLAELREERAALESQLATLNKQSSKRSRSSPPQKKVTKQDSVSKVRSKSSVAADKLREDASLQREVERRFRQLEKSKKHLFMGSLARSRELPR